MNMISLIFCLSGTVILKIWWKVLIMALYTLVICILHNFVTGLHMNFPQTLIPVLGVTLGMLLVFRTNTAYDRYWEGRKYWSTLTVAIRNMSRLVWVMVKEPEDVPLAETIIEKVSILKLLVAYAYATKNYLREQYAYDKDELKELINHIPRFSSPLSLEMKKEGKKSPSKCAHAVETPTNIPIEITMYLASYIASIKDRGLVENTMVSGMNIVISSMIDCLTGCERILRTPIPLAYSVHLTHAVFIYLLALPYQLVGPLNWFTIPAIVLASFCLLGMLEIGWEIENPFGHDANDLPLDDFCKVIEREVQKTISNRIPPIKKWVMSSDNKPFGFECGMTAPQLAKLSDDEIKAILVKSGTEKLTLKSSDKVGFDNFGANTIDNETTINFNN